MNKLKKKLEENLCLSMSNKDIIIQIIDIVDIWIEEIRKTKKSLSIYSRIQEETIDNILKELE